MTLEPRALQIVITLSEELHFRRAAAKLDMSQPALTAALDLNWLCSVLARARRELPNAIDLMCVDSAAVPDLLLNRKMDAAFMLGRLRHPELRFETLTRDALDIAVPRNDSLAGLPIVSRADLKDRSVTLLRRDTNPAAYSDFLALCNSCDYQTNIAQEVNTFDEGLHFTSEALALTFVPSFIQLVRNHSP